MSVSVAKLSECYSVLKNKSDDLSFDVWGCETTIETISDRLSREVYEPRAYNASLVDYDHAARVAYLVKHRDETPIEIDVGIPSLGYYEFLVHDGNHRLAAAIYRGDLEIPASVVGEIEYIDHLFVTPK